MRAQVIRAARALLQADGPQAITLKAVAAEAGVTHGNVTYHFGTVAVLHTALITAIIEDITLATATAAAVAHLRQGEMSVRDVVDVVFDAFAVGGAGQRAGGADAIGLMMAAIVVPALGESLIGAGMEAGLGLEQGAVRQFITDGQARLRESHAPATGHAGGSAPSAADR